MGERRNLQDSVVILGCRGSIPVAGKQFEHFGQATSCLLLRLGGSLAVVDAGTGILDLGQKLLPEEVDIPLILTHAHLDHLLGLPMCPMAFRPDCRFHLYGKSRGGLTAEQQLRCLFAPPLWPVGPEVLPASFDFQELEETMALGAMQVVSLEGHHPGGVSLLRFQAGGKRVAVLLDCTLEGPWRETLLDFARDVDLLLCDGQYSPQEWPSHSHFGHSSWTQAAQFARDCGAKRLRVLHHDPNRSDEDLQKAQKELQEIHPDAAFAYSGEELLL